MAKGPYTLRYPEKYMGNKDTIFYRSSWEKRFFEFCEFNPNVKKWASEEIAIPYIKPTDKKFHKYYPDIYIEYVDANGEYRKELIEIKPAKEAYKSKTKSTYDKLAYVINEAKWDAATQFCSQHGIKFRIMTENSLFRTK